jgi:hypothetical protein
MFNRLPFPAAFFFATSMLGLLLAYYEIGGNKLHLSLSALMYGIVLGLVVQLCVRQSLPKLRIGIASFCGSFALWLPVVVVTYGFAIKATPFFVAYAAAVVLGIYAAVLIQRSRHSKGAAS